MGVTAGSHFLGPWLLPTRKVNAYSLPTILATSVTYTSESCSSHPDPSRASFRLFVPSLIWDALAWDLGQSMRAFVWAHGLDPAGSGAIVANRNVAYFEGEVDGLERYPVKGRAFLARGYDVANVTPTDGTVTVTQATPTSAAVVRNNSDAPVDVTYRTGLWLPAAPMTNPAVGYFTGTHYRGGRVRVSAMVAEDPRGPRNPDGYVGPPTVKVSVVGGTPADWFDFTGRPAGGDVLDVTVTLTGVEANSNCSVIVTGIEPDRGRPDGYEVLAVGSDFLAKLGRLSVGDTPWTYQTAAGRILYNLRPLTDQAGVGVDYYPYRDSTGEEPGGLDVMNSTYVRPRDVDSRSALEIYQRTVAAVGRLALGLAGRVGVSYALTPQYTVQVQSGTAKRVQDLGWVSDVPTDAIPNVPLTLTADRVATKVTADWYKPGDEQPANQYDVDEVTSGITHASAVGRYGVVDRRLATDAYTTSTATSLEVAAPALWQKMDLMLQEQAIPEWYFGEDLKLIPRELNDVFGLAELIDNATRFGRAIRLYGARPKTIDEWHRVHGGRFGWDGKRWTLELEVEPINFSGVDAGRFSAAEARTDLTLDAGTSLTLNDMRSVKL